ncbi:hypothetical protein KP509_39G031700 [Ceratopteris richardii]|uniref:Hexosyltransferase n=3 Tax=Ceratopteris richardii TaxID=49495 RepID=A0A8T2Q031_CERRI|nr:hypothetical protein KP509_39G031700 [Ceratopteris richardii]
MANTRRLPSSPSPSFFGRRSFLSAFAVIFLLFTVFATSSRDDSNSHTGSEELVSDISGQETHLMRRLTSVTSDPLRSKVDSLFKQATEHLSIANTYASYARISKLEMMKEVRIFTEQARAFTELLNKPRYRALLTASKINRNDLNSFYLELTDLIKVSREHMAEARAYFDNQLRAQKLNDTISSVTDQLAKAKKQGSFASLMAAKSIPKSLHCLSTRLMEERISNPSKFVDYGDPPPELEDPELYHYAIFSDNVLAASVVVNSAVANAREPEKHVFHVVTDKMNFWAMKAWFTLRPPNNVTHIEVKTVEDYTFLNSSYVPVLKQLKSADLLKFYFENQMENATKDARNMKFRNPKYLSMLNHLRFYLAQMYPNLHRILFLDDDIVVQKDLTALWEIDMDGKVNAAVETCFGSFHRYSQYMNFSHPLVKERFDPKACAWAYGMNLFDLDAWRKEKCTEEYHYWQTQNENRLLWKLGTLPPGLMTFYKTTKPLDKSWHVLGLGYNPNISHEKIKSAAVIHYNGNMKPWLDLGMKKYKKYWTKYIDSDMELIRACNIIMKRKQ